MINNNQPVNLGNAFPPVPEEAEKTMRSSLAQLQKRRRVYPKRKFALIAATVLITVSLTAIAAFHSQVAELFGKLFGKETQQWIEGGVVDPDGKSFTLAGATFTIDECVYRDRGLYFLGSVRADADAKVVILPPDWDKQAPFGYDIYGAGPEAEIVPEGAKSYEQVAAEAKKELAVACIGIDKLASQDNVLLAPECYGTTIYPIKDGSLRFALEVEDGSLIMPADKYQVQMYCRVGEHTDTWDMTVRPTIEIATEQLVEPAASTQTDVSEVKEEPVQDKPEEKAESVVSVQTVPVAQKEQARETVASNQTEEPVVRKEQAKEEPKSVETNQQQASQAKDDKEQKKDAPAVKEEPTPENMPVYRAKKWEFIEKIDLALFNQSEVLKDDRRVQRNETFRSVSYQDGGSLEMSDGCIDYHETKGEWNYSGEDNYGKPVDNYGPKETVANQVADLGDWAYFGWPGTYEQLPLEKTSLTYLTLDEAKAQAEAMLKELGLKDFVNTYAIDLGVDRIHALGEDLKACERAGKYSTNCPMEYDLATVEDEGFYLYYEQPLFNKTELSANASFYVTKKGIVKVGVRRHYEPGDIIETPETFVSSESVIERLPQDMASAKYPDKVTEIIDTSLCYYPLADKKGVKLIPVWHIEFNGSENNHYWAAYDAVTGKFVDGNF
ncbi:MAG TPA: hypothetical protein GXZ86_04155 [Clostridiales bacterium]|jgi:hypothetical protein|nr:hypothetical protein [Clostridiales bacterium]